MKTICTRRSGLLALRPERMLAVQQAGGIILEFGEPTPQDGILLTDARPKKFIGGRTATDPAATAIYQLSHGKMMHLHHFEDFDRALLKAQRLAAE